MKKGIEKAPTYRIEFKVYAMPPKRGTLSMVAVARTMKHVNRILKIFRHCGPDEAWCYGFKLFNNLTGELIKDLDKKEK